MKFQTIPLLLSFGLLGLPLFGAAKETPKSTAKANSSQKAVRIVDYVKPFVGTQDDGNTYPGPQTPFGMVQFSPDTENTLHGTASGYKYTDTSIMGFSCTHLSGTGIPDLGDFLFMPQLGEPKLVPGTRAEPDPGYRQRFSKEDETALCGYYKVKLENGVNVELTAADRSGIMRFTFPENDQASIMTDLHHNLDGAGRPKVVWSHVRVEDKQTVTGFHLLSGWAKERYIYFTAKYSRPFDDHVIMSNGQPHIYNTYRFRSRNEASGPNLQFLAKYKTKKDEVIQVKIGISAVSAKNALMNLDAEIPHWDFEKIVAETQAKWEKELQVAEVEGTQAEKETYYTALYHALLTPNIYQDVNGEYRGYDFNVHKADFTRYSVFSLWDTYRALHPLFNLIQPKRNVDMINSMLIHYDQSVDKLLPIWELDGMETWCMIGYHAVPPIVDAYLKGLKGFDAERAYQAIKTTAMNPDYDSVALYAKIGYVPFDKENESVSKTLEYAFNDFCIAQMAKAMGKTEDYNYFMKRAGAYKNIYDASIGWMRSKDTNGNWRDPWDPHRSGGGAGIRPGDITEGTSSQYSWYVPHDVPGLISLMGGRDEFIKKLDSIFTYVPPPRPQPQPGQAQPGQAQQGQGQRGQGQPGQQGPRPPRNDGRIGEYWHGNEPSHHILYLYSYVGQPEKAAKYIQQIVRSNYGNKPNSLAGNDDCGQMSAWYLFTAMGFYPVCPGSSYYVIGVPCLPKVKLNLPNGKQLVMEANGLSEKNMYVQSLKVNGKDWNNTFLPYNEIKDGGTLVFTMGARPSKWGTKPVIPAE